MEVTIHYNGQAVAVEVTLEVYIFLMNHRQIWTMPLPNGWQKLWEN